MVKPAASSSALLSPFSAASPPILPDGSFESILTSARDTAPEALARRSAEEFVAQSLVLPVLKSLREQNDAAPPFAPGPYEKNIASLYDMEIASRLVRAQRFPIVDAVARNLLEKRGTDPAHRPRPEHGGSNDGTPLI
jgi:hypothetical protein